jgi:hypothetical protein
MGNEDKYKELDGIEPNNDSPTDKRASENTFNERSRLTQQQNQDKQK